MRVGATSHEAPGTSTTWPWSRRVGVQCLISTTAPHSAFIDATSVGGGLEATPHAGPGASSRFVAYSRSASIWRVSEAWLSACIASFNSAVAFGKGVVYERAFSTAVLAASVAAIACDGSWSGMPPLLSRHIPGSERDVNTAERRAGGRREGHRLHNAPCATPAPLGGGRDAGSLALGSAAAARGAGARK